MMDTNKQKSSNNDDGFIAKKTGELNYYLVRGTIWKELKTIIPGDSGEGFDDAWMENDKIRTIRKFGGIFVNDIFIKDFEVEGKMVNLWDVNRGLMFLDGGYGSSKTTFVITKLLMKARTAKYFKCFYGRQKKTEARQLHDNIIREIERNGWEAEFKYSMQPTGSTHILHISTGNQFQMFGCDDIDSLKGIDNPSDVFIDEINQISWEHFGMIFTRLRGSGYVTQLIACFNNCDVFPDHWLVKYIYGDENSDDPAQQATLDALRKITILKHHSTYADNHCQNPDEYYQKLVIKAGGNPDKIKAFCDGEWGIKLSAQPYYKMFKSELHVVSEIIVDGCKGYNPNLPLHISFDENSNPYLPALIGQLSGTKIYFIDEIAGVNPFNSLIWICKEVKERYPNHKAGVYIYGDATSRKDDVKIEDGKDFYQLITQYLACYNPQVRVPAANPNNAIRRDFVNAILSIYYGDLSIIISRKCKHLIEDMMHTQEAPDGKGKDKTRTTVNGIKGVQRYGHFGDCLDYLICEAYQYQYILFQRGGVIYDVAAGQRIVNNKPHERMSEAIREHKSIEKLIDSENVDEEDDDTIDIYENYRRKSKNGY